jgi:hypothetical protein
MIVTDTTWVIDENATKFRIIEDHMGLLDIFKKNTAEQPIPVVAQPAAEATVVDDAPAAEKIKKPRKARAKKTEPAPEAAAPKIDPEVKVLKFEFDPENPRLGSIELDWNIEFVHLLRSHGYSGNTDEDIVDAWLMDVCKTISTNEFPMSDNVRYIQRRDLGGGKTEFS